MEIKKSEKANLENRRLLFTEIGFVIALLIVFGAFEYTSREKKESSMQAEAAAVEEEEMIPITQETPPPPPEVPDIPLLSDQIDIVDDNIKVDDNILNLEDDANLGVDLKDYIAGDVDNEEVEEADVPFAIVEEKPKFMGKDPTVAFSKWVGEHLDYLAQRHEVHVKHVFLMGLPSGAAFWSLFAQEVLGLPFISPGVFEGMLANAKGDVASDLLVPVASQVFLGAVGAALAAMEGN